ncbi:HEPN domain-containing protein [Candidatus Woesearchaeota archaeon]|nr:HEPN domain-containing protein [Candidatus Woesearchaeota archaeon]
MKEFWKRWIEDDKKLNNDFKKYLKSKKIKVEGEKDELVKGHLDKADHNLKFVKSTLELEEFNDWAIVSAYYSIYHASLALCVLRGFSTKDHSATLLILIKEFYKKELTKEEIELIKDSTIEKEHVLYYVKLRKERSKASYSTKISFTKQEAESLRLKAIEFVNKVKEIVEG